MHFKRRAAKLVPLLVPIVLGVSLYGCLGMDRKAIKLDLISFTIDSRYEYKSVLTAKYDYVFIFLEGLSPIDIETVQIGMFGPVPIEEGRYLIPQTAQREDLEGKEIAEYTMPGNLIGKSGELYALAVIQNEKIVIVFSLQIDELEKEARLVAESLGIRKD